MDLLLFSAADCLDKEKGKWVDLDAGDEVALSTLSVAPIALTNTCSCATLLMHL